MENLGIAVFLAASVAVFLAASVAVAFFAIKAVFAQNRVRSLKLAGASAAAAFVGLIITAVTMDPLPESAAVAEVAAKSPLSSEDVRQARHALERHYIERGIYKPVLCDSAEGETRIWVRCHAVHADAPIGGLFFVLPGEDGAPQIWAGNGKAIQHLGDATSLPDLNDHPVIAGRWRGDPVDMAEGFDAFGVTP